MRSLDSVIGRRVVYHDFYAQDGLTNNGVYTILDERRSKVWSLCIECILILNDNGEEEWYDIGLGIDRFWLLSGNYVRYIGPKNSWITEGKLIYGVKYELIDRYDDRYIYFIDSAGYYVGPSRINYLGGGVMFEDVPIDEVRSDKLCKIFE